MVQTGAKNNKTPSGDEVMLSDLIWWREADLNHRPSGYEPDELPDCSIPRRFY
jgi:hypothetical protein